MLLNLYTKFIAHEATNHKKYTLLSRTLFVLPNKSLLFIIYLTNTRNTKHTFYLIVISIYILHFMKPIHYSFFIVLISFFTSCQQQKTTTPNHFSSSADTLLIQTTKQKGDGIFQIGAVENPFIDVTSEFPHKIIYPKELTTVQRSLFIRNLEEKQLYYVDIIKGNLNGKAVFIVDENNNKDLTDDSIYPVTEMEWDSHKNLVKCKYTILDKGKKLSDSSWLKIGLSNKHLSVGRSDHVQGTFTIDSHSFQLVAAAPFSLSFLYNIHPQLALIQHKNTKKDTILNRDLLKLGEYLKLDGTYYKFHSISKTGAEITLIKEKSFDTKIGLQTGMIAPEFTAVTTENDTIRSINLHDKITVIANSCGCGGDKVSTQAYFDMQEAYQNIHMLRVDSKIKKQDYGLHIDVNTNFNKDFYNKYRGQYCSRICYVIGENNRILDKFIISDWKIALRNILN